MLGSLLGLCVAEGWEVDGTAVGLGDREGRSVAGLGVGASEGCCVFSHGGRNIPETSNAMSTASQSELSITSDETVEVPLT